jgi:hypothetical protein
VRRTRYDPAAFAALLARIRERLAAGGRVDWLQRLEDAEAGGSTGTEVVVRLAVELRALRQSAEGAGVVDPAMRADISTAEAMVTDVLRHP